MNSNTHGRDGAKTTVATILSSIAAVLVAYALIVAFVIHPPALGWVGFAIVSIIVLGLGALAPLAFERTRVSAQRPAVAPDREQRLLVIADPLCSETAVCDEILARLDGAVAVHLVVPVRVSHLRFLTDDESEEWREAEQSMSISVGLLQQRGLPATGSVGSDKPLESMTDALGSFSATHVLLVTPPEEESYWLERGLVAKARALTSVPVTQVVVPTTSPVGPAAGERGAAGFHSPAHPRSPQPQPQTASIGADVTPSARHEKGVSMPNIVIGYDGSESAKRALERAAALAGDGSLTLVSAAVPLAGKGGLAYDPVEREEHARQLQEAGERLSELGLRCRLVEGWGDPARMIASQAEEQNADLIVVGTNHKNLLERLIVGSVSTDVLHRAKTEVLIVP